MLAPQQTGCLQSPRTVNASETQPGLSGAGGLLATQNIPAYHSGPGFPVLGLPCRIASSPRLSF